MKAYLYNGHERTTVRHACVSPLFSFSMLLVTMMLYYVYLLGISRYIQRSEMSRFYSTTILRIR